MTRILVRLSRASALIVSIALCATSAVTAQDPGPVCPVDPERELFVTDLSVVNDCVRTTWGPCPFPEEINARGAWTFGHLIEGIAGTTDANVLSDFVLKWLNHWDRNLTINGDDVPRREAIRSLVIDPWLHASGGVRLDMKKAPFRLLAIVARLDLRRQPAAGNPTAGEARFVYGVLDLDDPDALPQFTVIVEYNLKARTCDDIKQWAQRWHALGSIHFGRDYNRALQSVTDLFTRIGSDPDRPNRSALNQLRSNEIALAGPWELREFRLVPKSMSPSSLAPLVQTTVAQTPNADLNNRQIIADYINEFSNQILNGTYQVPLQYEGESFRGGAAPNNLTTWDGPLPSCSEIQIPEARHLFSLGTCNSCHGGETDIRFLQVEPRFQDDEARLSDFLTGGPTGAHTVTDPCGLDHTFNDIRRRVVDLCKLLSDSCADLAQETPLSRVH